MNNSPEFGLNERNGFEEAIRHLEKPGIGEGITVINEGEGDSEKGEFDEIGIFIHPQQWQNAWIPQCKWMMM